MGIDTKRIRRLKRIVRATGAKIVLSSDWRHYYNVNSKEQKGDASKYLYNKMRRAHLTIYDKTPNIKWERRGLEIKFWLNQHPEVDNYIILDDRHFDFSKEGLLNHFINTIEYTEKDEIAGLTDYLADVAIEMLNGMEVEGPILDAGWTKLFKS